MRSWSGCGLWLAVAGCAALSAGASAGLAARELDLVVEYFAHRQLRHACYLSCGSATHNKLVVSELMARDIRASVKAIAREGAGAGLQRALRQWRVPVGVLLDSSCAKAQLVLETASEGRLFDAAHAWLALGAPAAGGDAWRGWRRLALSVDADVVVASCSRHGDRYELTDVFNFGKIQGNSLEKDHLGTWHRAAGLNISLTGFKYYNRWDFHNLTLRAVSVVRGQPAAFHPELLHDAQPSPGVAAMTKVAGQLLLALREHHNFRFNYTLADRWIGAPDRNSALAVSNSLHWRQQDVACTCTRIFSKWLDWVDPFFPPATNLETKFYYLISEHGVGEYENRFLTPLSQGAWALAGAAGAASALLLAAAAAAERRPQPALYAISSVLASACQQGRRAVLLVVGLTSMLLYNYYTSSVVSWLLSAAPPALGSLRALLRSDLELVFEDIGYTTGWLDSPGFYYYSGFKSPVEDELRDKKVTQAKRTVPVLQSVERGVELMRTGRYAYHTEPYTASQQLGRRLGERELCRLGALQMMPPAPVYIVAQKRSPYKEFFVWSLMRLMERGHVVAARARLAARMPACSGSTPRALALGQAAPAFALLALATLLAALLLAAEILWHRMQNEDR